MIKKSVLLAISIVFAAVACAFGFRSEPVSYGRGSGENAVIATHAEMSELLKSVPSSASLLNAENGTEAVRSKYTSFSLREQGALTTTRSISRRVGSLLTNERTESTLDRYMEAYYTETAAYYRGIGTLKNSMEKEVYENLEEADVLSSRLVSLQVNSATQSFDWEIYISAGALYVK